MTTVNQGMSVEEIEQVVAQRVANAIEAIAIYETKTNMACKLMSQTKRQEDNVAENASNKRKQSKMQLITPELMGKKISTLAERQAENKRKLDNNNQDQQQPPKKQGVAIADTARPGEKKEYAGTLPLCNKCKFHHNGQCTIKCANCKRVGHLTRDCRSPATTNNQRNSLAINV
ncbi:reverse transcriptase domain-containing protein [Tanacetum coccineum]